MREVIKKGTDVRAIRKPINDAFAKVPARFISEGAATEQSGDTISFSVVGEDIFYIKLDSKTGTSPIKYAWTMMVQDRDTGAWVASPRAGLTTDDSWAGELNNASLATGTGKRYPARFNPQTGRVIFDQGGTGGNVDIKGGETVLMILGDYDTYKDCPGVPPKPPTTWTDGCQTARSATLCVPAFAYAVYQRCGYIWNKIGDTRDFQVWANEMNGQAFGAWRRFVIPRWGGDIIESTGLPDPASACMGVAFLGAGAGSALTCSCPACLTTPPEGVELCLRFRTIPRPASPMECGGLVTAMDAESAWDREYVVPLTKASGFCSVGGVTDDGIFTLGWDWQDGPSISCDWGPDVFDPCDPCEHWGRIFANITSNFGGAEPNCGAGVWSGEFKSKDLCSLICDCGNGPIEPVDQKHCNGCGNNQTPPAVWNAIVEGSIELICCSEGEIDGGSPASLPTDIIDGGSPGSLPTDIIDGGTV